MQFIKLNLAMATFVSEFEAPTTLATLLHLSRIAFACYATLSIKKQVTQSENNLQY